MISILIFTPSSFLLYSPYEAIIFTVDEVRTRGLRGGERRSPRNYMNIIKKINSRFEAVTHHPQAELYYSILTNRDAPERDINVKISKNYVDAPRSALDTETKKTMCHDIFSAGYFDMFGEDPIGVDEAFADLETNHKSLLDNVLCQKSRFSTHEKMISITDTRWIKNILLRTSSTQTIFSQKGDYVFTCLTRNRNTCRTSVYFISDEYNIGIDTIVYGHFLLQPCDENKTVVKAIAEEPAHVTTIDLENHYRSYRKTNPIARHEEEDPVCRLGILHKNRVCSTVLNSSFFKNKIKFWPHEGLLNPKCKKVKVSFRTETIKQKLGQKLKSFKEWMLPCPAKPIADIGRNVYFVSRASKSGEAFVYSQDDSTGQLFLENLSQGVSSISLMKDQRSLIITSL